MSLSNSIPSYAMVASLEALAELMDIPDAVVGFTVSAAGTSLPNYVASKVAAENGFGNQAVSNAFGSNTFNLSEFTFDLYLNINALVITNFEMLTSFALIVVGLGLPWLLYIGANGFEPYHGLRNEGITQSILILAGVLAVFVIMMLKSNFVIYKWHGLFFLGAYVAYVTFAIAQVYIGNDST